MGSGSTYASAHEKRLHSTRSGRMEPSLGMFDLWQVVSVAAVKHIQGVGTVPLKLASSSTTDGGW